VIAPHQALGVGDRGPPIPTRAPLDGGGYLAAAARRA
jgi:hypothetical protein